LREKIRKVSEEQVLANSALNSFLQNRDGIALHDKHVINPLLDHIEKSYSGIAAGSSSNVGIVQLKDFILEEYLQHDTLCIIAEISKVVERSDMFKNFIVHGSCSDFRIVDGWSDFDCIAVVKRSSLSRRNRFDLLKVCIELDEKMRTLDPYQHHGIHYIHEDELLSFPNLYLPVDVLRSGKCVLSNGKLEICRVDSLHLEVSRFRSVLETLQLASESGVLRHHAKDGKFLKESYEDADTMYQLKYLISLVSLLPAYWCNISGLYCEKPQAYAEMRKQFSPDQLEFFEKCSDVRFGWKRHFHDSNIIHEDVMNILGSDYLLRAYRFARLLNEFPRAKND